MSKIFIHCGLHKTGTTSLQLALRHYFAELRNAGFLYPLAGRPGEHVGQHNIAWQMARDRRFHHDAGTIEDLLMEISAFPGNIILSSEDLESSITYPGRWLPLIQAAKTANKEVELIVYVRNQLSYLDSIYQEMLRHGFGEEYGDFADNVLSHGTHRMHEWEFHFDYEEIDRALSSIPDVKITFRNYHALLHGSSIADFCSITGIPQEILQGAASLHINTRDSVETSLTYFHKNRTGSGIHANDQSAITKLCSQLASIPDTSPSTTQIAITQKFLESNSRLCAKYKLPLDGLVPTDHGAPLTTLDMRKVFSFETQLTISKVSQLIAQAGEGCAQQVEDDITHRAHDWANWIKGAANNLLVNVSKSVPPSPRGG